MSVKSDTKNPTEVPNTLGVGNRGEHYKLDQLVKVNPKKSWAQKIIMTILSLIFIGMLLISFMLSTTMFSRADSDKMVLISIPMVGLSCLFGCGVYSYSNHKDHNAQTKLLLDMKERV